MIDKNYLKEIGVTNFKITYDGYINSNDSISLNNYRGPENRITDTRLRVKFGEINGSFNCHFSDLRTSKGLPHTVHGDFYCSHSRFSDLKYGPKIVDGDFECSNTDITTLEGFPKKVENLRLTTTQINSLEFCCEEVIKNFSCIDNYKLTTLYGLPKTIGGKCTIFSCKFIPVYEYRWIFFSHIGGNIELSSSKLEKFLNNNKNPPKKDLPRLLSELRKITL